MNAARQVRPVKSQNPKAPTRPRDTSRALTASERSAVIALAYERAAEEGLDPRTQRNREAVADVIAFMAGTGVRIGEALGLRWEHIHLTKRTGYVHLHGTKSKSARRRLDLPRWLVDVLHERIERTEKSFNAASANAKRTETKTRSEVVAELQSQASRVGVEGFVFQAPGHWKLERPWDESNSSNAVRDLLDAAGLRWATGHSLRRTVATMLGEAGIPLARIADQLGHADPAMTASVYLGRDFEGEKSALAAVL